ncbi:MAG: twin-arginine translocase subunit TatC, partial [bacterium]|nr:twin-arginine translocase subunit TatC [bacterium]
FSLPFIFFHIWRFCAPGLLSNEKRYAFPFVIASTLCFTIGALFCYYLILPYGLSFLLSFATDSLVPQISIGFYISFVFKLLLVFGLVFEVPLITLLLVKIGVVTPEFLTSNRSYVIVGAFVVAAILTPPDIVTQLLLAGPLLALYEISVVIAKVMARKKKAKAAAEEEEDSA